MTPKSIPSGALKVADPIDSDEHPIWIAIIGWLNSEGSDASVAAVNAAIKAECAKRKAEPLTGWLPIDLARRLRCTGETP